MIGADTIAICAGKQVQQGLQVFQGGGHDDRRHLRSLPADSRQLRACHVSLLKNFLYTDVYQSAITAPIHYAGAVPCKRVCKHTSLVTATTAAASVHACAQGCIHWCCEGRLLNGVYHDTVKWRIKNVMGRIATHAAVATSPHHSCLFAAIQRISGWFIRGL